MLFSRIGSQAALLEKGHEYPQFWSSEGRNILTLNFFLRQRTVWKRLQIKIKFPGLLSKIIAVATQVIE